MARLEIETYEDGETVRYAYDNSGNLATVTDSETGVVTTYYYDLLNRQSGYREQGTNYDHSVTYTYDAENNLSSMTEVINGVTKTYSYTYNEDNNLISETVDGITVEYTYDGFGRLENRVVKNGDTVIQTNTPSYSAGNGENSTSTQVASYNGDTYTYDANGNITSIYTDGSLIRYVYDSQGQLIWEKSDITGYATQWEYDNAGNIVSRKVYDFDLFEVGALLDTVLYEYEDDDWGDLLTSYDGKDIDYDDVGNPTSDREWTYTWKHGRQLASMTKGNTTWSYTYDAGGMRTERSPGYTEGIYTYVYNGSQLSQMIYEGYTYSFTYDAAGTPLTFTEGNNVYYYETNLQGDVIGIKDSSGQQVVIYAYDAWGNVQILQGNQIAVINPLLYRGYVYDWETGLYYLQSRYYNPEWGRFINADVYAATGQGFVGNNMFAYCLNNPVMYTDSTGTIAIFDDIVCGVLIVVVAVVAVLLVPPPTTKKSFSKSTRIHTPRYKPQLKVEYNRPKETQEVYEYSALARLTASSPKQKTHVHHIVPVGNFSNRSRQTQYYLSELHRTLKNAEINVVSDPFNLITVSAIYHSSLHSDWYIKNVYHQIMATDLTKDGIYRALFYLRLEIAARDPFAFGY